MGTRDELLEAVAVRYRAATRAEKGRILTEFAEISGYHRKHAERLLRRDHVLPRPKAGPCPTTAGPYLADLIQAAARLHQKRQAL